MKSIVEEAIARSAIEGRARRGDYLDSNYSNLDSDTDAELEEILRNLKTTIKIIGCGGGGSNSIQRMIGEGVQGADLIAINTDAQHLLHIRSSKKILIGRKKTRGLGAGSLPQIGADAAIESIDEINRIVEGADIVFITAGLGGGTGTGSAPIVAEAARDAGALTIAVVTLPFSVEGHAGGLMQKPAWSDSEASQTR